MLTLNNIHPLTDFLRNHKSHIEELKSSGSTQIFTVNGRPEIVIMGTDAYTALTEKIEELSRLEAIRIGIEAVNNGEVVDAKKAREELKVRHGL